MPEVVTFIQTIVAKVHFRARDRGGTMMTDRRGQPIFMTRDHRGRTVSHLHLHTHTLTHKGYAYESNGSVYFDVAAFDGGTEGHCYGKARKAWVGGRMDGGWTHPPVTGRDGTRGKAHVCVCVGMALKTHTHTQIRRTAHAGGEGQLGAAGRGRGCVRACPCMCLYV